MTTIEDTTNTNIQIIDDKDNKDNKDNKNNKHNKNNPLHSDRAL